MFNLILFGPPGSGKGTQSDKLVSKYNLVHLSTGNLLRAEISHKTPLGIEAKNFIDKGQLVPDEMVIAMIDNCLNAHTGAAGFLFDGFPRTAHQAKALDKLLSLRKSAIHLVLALEVSEDELVHRLMERGKTSGRTDDMTEEVIRKRFTVYRNDTQPVAEHYKALGKFKSIPGEGSVEAIFEAVSGEIDRTTHD